MDLTDLFSALEEELYRVRTIRDRRTNNRKPMKDMGWVRRLPRHGLSFNNLSATRGNKSRRVNHHLLNDVEHYSKNGNIDQEGDDSES
jgi:hypothetical protein